MHTDMRPHRPLRRFSIVVALAFVLAVPTVAQAAMPPDREPGSARQPVSHPSQESGAEVGAVRIPAIGVHEVIRAGVAIEVIDRGVAHWAGTAQPGGTGNVVLAGHRTTHTRPFHDLDRLRPGHLVFVQGGDDFEVMYRVEESFIVDPTAIWITYDSPTPTLTMFACHPKGSAAQRIVVTAELVAGGRIA